MITLGSALEAFIREHEYCGELETGLENASGLDAVHVRGWCLSGGSRRKKLTLA